MVPKKSVGSGDGKEETSVKAIADTEMEGGANKRWLRVSRLGDWEKAADAINRNTETRERSWTLKKKKKRWPHFSQIEFEVMTNHLDGDTEWGTSFGGTQLHLTNKQQHLNICS